MPKNLSPYSGSEGDKNMDYSAFYPTIWFMYFGTFAGIITAIILLVCGDIFLIKQYLKSKAIIELVGMVACVVAIIAVCYFSRNFFKDIPNVINKNYIISSGTVITGNNGGIDPEARDFAFKKDDDGKTVKIIANSKPIQNGERFEVIYLPNTGYGAITKRFNEGGELP